jgi:hypothetical protein
VGSRPVSVPTFDHWLSVAAAEAALASPGEPVIVPLAPPGFGGCIRQVRRKLHSLDKLPDRRIRVDCAQLFTSLASEVMPFLIRSYWYEAQAALSHVVVTEAQVRREFERDKRRQFHSERAFRRFLEQTRQTVGDILFRVRVSLIDRRLLEQFGGHQAALDRVVANGFKPTTSCRRPYSVATVCGHTIGPR